jgi:hypothetical protein
MIPWWILVEHYRILRQMEAVVMNVWSWSLNVWLILWLKLLLLVNIIIIMRLSMIWCSIPLSYNVSTLIIKGKLWLKMALKYTTSYVTIILAWAQTTVNVQCFFLPYLKLDFMTICSRDVLIHSLQSVAGGCSFSYQQITTSC